MDETVAGRLTGARLYLCTDARARQGDLEAFAHAALAGGVDVIQLRDKGLEAKQEIALVELLAEVARSHGALVAVNDRADVAAVVRPDILHLGQDDLPLAAARRILGAGVLLGRSTHARAEVDQAVADPFVGYFCAGPTWPTPTKPGRPAPGLDLLRHAAAVAGDKPWFAIGGIGPDTLDAVLEAGARRIVVVRAITDADDPEAAARALRARLPT